MESFVRWAGRCLVLSGVLTLTVLAHPDVFATGFADPSASGWWVAGHAAGVFVAVLSITGYAGLAVRHGARLGRAGAAGFGLTLVGLVATAGLMTVEAFVFPVLAREDPALLELEGPLLGSLAVRAVGGLALLWFVGLAVLGVLVERSAVLPRGAGALLAVGAVAFAAFEGPFVPVLGSLSVVLFAAAQARFGLALVRSVRGADVAHPVPT